MRPFVCLFPRRTLGSCLLLSFIHTLFVFFFADVAISMLHNPTIGIQSQSQRKLLGACQSAWRAGSDSLLPAARHGGDAVEARQEDAGATATVCMRVDHAHETFPVPTPTPIHAVGQRANCIARLDRRWMAPRNERTCRCGPACLGLGSHYTGTLEPNLGYSHLARFG